MADAPSINYETENPPYEAREAESEEKALYVCGTPNVGAEETEPRTNVVAQIDSGEWIRMSGVAPVDLEEVA